MPFSHAGPERRPDSGAGGSITSMRTTAFIGLGLVGGSLARGMIRAGDRVLGWDSQPGTRLLARSSGVEIIEPEKMAASADLVVVATPPDQAGPIIKSLLDDGARAVTDTASVKAPLAGLLADHPRRKRWLGGHPMAGSQGSGWQAADPDLFTHMTWAACSDDQPRLEVLLEVSRLVEAFNGAILPARPEDHDQEVAFSSHMVQVVQQTLASALAGRPSMACRLSGPALRDSTRLAESPLQGMWAEILESNKDSVTSALDGLIDELQVAREAISDGEKTVISSLWRQGALGRERLVRMRWQRRNWRTASLPLGTWWPGLVQLGRSGALIRNPREDSGALLLFEQC